MRFVLYLVDEGHLAPAEALSVLQAMCRRTPPLGSLVIKSRLLSISVLRELLEVQRRDKQPLGMIAVDKGLISQDQLRVLLEEQRKETPGGRELVLEMGLMDTATLEAAHRRFVTMLS